MAKRDGSITSFFAKKPKVDHKINPSIMTTDINTTIDTSDFFYVVDSISKNIKNTNRIIRVFIKYVRLSSKEKFDLLNKNWCPDPAFKFPLSGKRKLRFQYSWFDRWNWLVYSFKELGAYCKLCLIFGQNVPFLDNFLLQLHDRFLKHNDLLQSFSCILPGYKINSATGQDIKYLIDTYQEDLNNSDLVINGEIYLWQEKCNKLDGSKSALDVFGECDKMIFPHIHKLLKILITLSVTTATGERSFSTLKRLKTYIRNSIGQARLNGLALMNIHRQIEINTDDVINQMNTKARRLNFRLE